MYLSSDGMLSKSSSIWPLSIFYADVQLVHNNHWVVVTTRRGISKNKKCRYSDVKKDVTRFFLFINQGFDQKRKACIEDSQLITVIQDSSIET